MLELVYRTQKLEKIWTEKSVLNINKFKKIDKFFRLGLRDFFA